MPILANIIQDAFSPLISVFEWILVFLHDHVLGGSWGLSIVGLTVLVRAVMVPLTLKQFRSMRKMQQLAPQLKAIQQRYKDDRQRQSEETMKFYRENGVNPFASCLPLALQLPILISLFYMLRTDLKLDICEPQLLRHYRMRLGNPNLTADQIPQGPITHMGQHLKGLSEIGCSQVPGGEHAARFLFIQDITLKETGVVLVVLLALYVGTQLLSSIMMSTAVDRNQRLMMLGLPLVFVLFFIRYPAGLLVYWITTNIWTIGQQYFVRRSMGPPPVPAQAPPGKDGAGSSGRRARAPALVASGAGESAEPGEKGTGEAAKPEKTAAGGRRGRSSAPAPAPSAPATREGGPAPPRPPRKRKKRSGRRR